MENRRRTPSGVGAIPVDVVRDLLHDLGGPLVAAQGFLTLLERAPGGPSAPRYVEALREAIANMQELIDRNKILYAGKTLP